MPYETLLERLRAGQPDLSVVALPDGSRDVLCSVVGADRLATREAFATRVAERRRGALSLERHRVEPGGQAVNAAIQADALGTETTLYGHLDDPVFDDLAFPTVSMGAPATVYLCGFDDGSVMLVDDAVREEWTFSDLRAVAEVPLDADALLLMNWSSFPGQTAALERMAAEGVAAETVVVDPGDVQARAPEARRAFLSALATLDRRTDVVLSANRSEVRALARTAGTDELEGRDGEDRAADVAAVERVREESVPTVLHERSRAVAAAAGAPVVVPNLALEAVARTTGAGDRFTAGLATALAGGADLDVALALGNACACHYVATGETGDRDALASFVAARY